MSTTPSTPERDQPYSIVGTPPRAIDPTQPAMVLLNRSSRLLRRELIERLVAQGYQEIVSVEPQERSYTVESLTREFPQVRFMLLARRMSIGGQINLAMRQLESERVLVHWSTIDPPSGVERAMAAAAAGRSVVVTPQLRGERGDAIPVLQAPALQEGSLRVLTLPLRGERAPTLFPFDYVGLYDRRLFLRFEGFDEEIENPYWQKLDFGFRCHLWGGEILALSGFRASYRSMPEPEDQTVSADYARFFARNLAIRLDAGGPRIPRLQVFSFALRSGFGVLRTTGIFRQARRWLQDRSSRFVVDPRSMVEQWSVEHV